MKITFKLNTQRSAIVLVFFLVFGFFSCSKKEDKDAKYYENIKVEGQKEAELTAPPLVPKPIGDRPAMKLVVNMEIKEQEGEMVDGVKYTYWTFGGSVPGSFIRTRVGDEVDRKSVV